MPYPTPPAQRFAYDLDGTIVKLRNGSGVFSVIASPALMNDEDSDYVDVGAPATATSHVIFLFPEPRTFSGYFVHTNTSTVVRELEYSTDTVDGETGTWTVAQATWTRNTAGITPTYRTSIVSVGPLAGVRAVRFGFQTPSGYDSAHFQTVHLYGLRPVAPGLVFVRPDTTDVVPAGWFDFGDIAQGSVHTKQFRVRNDHATYTAGSIDVTAQAATNTMAVEFSLDGTTYNPTVSIGSLAPGTISPAITVRRTVPAAEPARLQAARISAVAGAWLL